MVACFKHCIEGITIIDDVATPATVADVDPGAGTIIYGAMAHGDAGGHADLDASRLFLDAANAGNQAVFHEAIGWIVVIQWSSVDRIYGAVGVRRRSVVEERVADGRWVADETNAAGPDIMKVRSSDGATAVVVAEEDGVASHLVEFAG